MIFLVGDAHKRWRQHASRWLIDSRSSIHVIENRLYQSHKYVQYLQIQRRAKVSVAKSIDIWPKIINFFHRMIKGQWNIALKTFDLQFVLGSTRNLFPNIIDWTQRQCSFDQLLLSAAVFDDVFRGLKCEMGHIHPATYHQHHLMETHIYRWQSIVQLNNECAVERARSSVTTRHIWGMLTFVFIKMCRDIYIYLLSLRFNLIFSLFLPHSLCECLSHSACAFLLQRESLCFYAIVSFCHLNPSSGWHWKGK